MINKQFDNIVKTDIDELVSNQVPESRTLEYKQELPGNNDEHKKEFLADVSSFANASGGDILYGIVEHRDNDNKPTGLPELAKGVPVTNKDELQRRLDGMIRDGVDPKINGIQTKFIDGFRDGPVILIRILRSWSGPHRVIFKNWGHFFSRNSTSKYPLDVDELRSAFTLGATLSERIRNFRDERLGRIIANETPVPLFPFGKLALHLVPIAWFSSNERINLPLAVSKAALLDPIYPGVSTQRYNVDGYVTYGRRLDSTKFRGYVQLFRSGVIESVDGLMLLAGSDEQTNIPIARLEYSVVKAVNAYNTFYESIRVSGPVVVLLSILGVKDRTISAEDYGTYQDGTPFDRSELLLPDVVIEDSSIQAGEILRPVFDTLWQSAGYAGSPFYDESGNWQSPPGFHL